MLKAVLLVLSLAVALDAKKYCYSDDDCYDLGNLVCIKSTCDRGVCSCPRGRAAKYMGSTSLYQCVPIMKIGDSCSNAGSTGVCGPINSYCDEETGKCVCDSTPATPRVPKAGGEICVQPDELLIGETCSPGGIGDTCLDGSQCRSQFNGDTYWSEDVNFNVPTCACNNNEELQFTNSFFATNGRLFQEFVGAKEPICVQKTIGSSCVEDADCPQVDGRVTCINRVCACTNSSLVPDYFGNSCDLPIVIDTLCTGPNAATGHCNGAAGLVCGDSCDIYATGDSRCECGLGQTRSGNTCSAIAKGDPCFGDANCKGWLLTAICVDGRCQDGAAAISATILSVLLPILVQLWQN